MISEMRDEMPSRLLSNIADKYSWPQFVREAYSNMGEIVRGIECFWYLGFFHYFFCIVRYQQW